MAAVLASNVERAGHQTDEGEGDRERYGGGCVHVRKDCECGQYKENHRENDRKESDDPQFAIMTLNQPAVVDVIACMSSHWHTTQRARAYLVNDVGIVLTRTLPVRLNLA